MGRHSSSNTDKYVHRDKNERGQETTVNRHGIHIKEEEAEETYGRRHKHHHNDYASSAHSVSSHGNSKRSDSNRHSSEYAHRGSSRHDSHVSSDSTGIKRDHGRESTRERTDYESKKSKYHEKRPKYPDKDTPFLSLLHDTDNLLDRLIHGASAGRGERKNHQNDARRAIREFEEDFGRKERHRHY